MKLRFERKKATAMILKLKFAVKKERLDFEAEGETLHNFSNVVYVYYAVQC